VGFVAVVLLVAVPTAAAAAPFARARAQQGAEAAVHHVCSSAGSDGAVLVYGHRFLDVELPDAIRAFCGVPVGAATGIDLPQLARQWHVLGKRLLVAVAVPDPVLRGAPGATVVGHYVIADHDDPEKVFERAPRRFAPNPREIWLIRIPVSAT